MYERDTRSIGLYFYLNNFVCVLHNEGCDELFYFPVIRARKHITEFMNISIVKEDELLM